MLNQRTNPGARQFRGRRSSVRRFPGLLLRLWIALIDWLRGRELGAAHAHQSANTVTEIDHLIVSRIDAQTQVWHERLSATYSSWIEDARQAVGQATQTEQTCTERAAVHDKKEVELRAEEKALGKRRGAGELGFLSTLVALFTLMLPIDIGAVQLLPLSRGMQALFVVTLGGGMMVAADQAARKIDDLRNAHANREDDGFGYIQDWILMIVAVLAPLFVVGGTTVWRGKAFEASFTATGSALQGSAVNIGFSLVALMAFVVAVLVGVSYHRVKPLRRVRRARGANTRAKEHNQTLHGQAKNRKEQAKGAITSLESEREATLRALVSWGEERKAGIRRRALVIELRLRRREARRRTRRSTLGGPGTNP